MTMNAPTTSSGEARLQAFLERLPEGSRLPARTVAHAWAHGGGRLRTGRVAVRLTGGEALAFTAATIHAPSRQERPYLEVCRVILQNHGVAPAGFRHWADELADLQELGFDPQAKFPTVPLDDALDPPRLARLAGAVRDLAAMLARERPVEP